MFYNCFKAQNTSALIKRIHDAVKTGHIIEPFSGRSIKNWMDQYKIMKDDGTPYSKGYKPTSLLSDSLIKPVKTKNTNSKWLRRRRNDDGIYEYWFED